MGTPVHNSSHLPKDNPEAVHYSGWMGHSHRVYEQKRGAAPPHMVIMQPLTAETSAAANYQKISEGQGALTSVLMTGSTSGPRIQMQPTRSPRDRLSEQSLADHTTHHIWLLPQHELPFPLGPALCIFKQAILGHHKHFGGNHREALIPFLKITSGGGKGQRGGVWRPFCKSFKYPGIDPIKRIMKGKQPSLSFSH